MAFTRFCVCLSLFVLSNAYLLNDLFGHRDQCKQDVDCGANACCLSVAGSLGSAYKKCSLYTLPAGPCYTTAGSYGCGCMPGYNCEVGTGDLALEPNTKLKGFCKPTNGTSGPQIAVEGGR